MTRIYYTTRPIAPCATYAMVDADRTTDWRAPALDMSTLMHLASEIVTEDTAMFLRATYGADSVAHVDTDRPALFLRGNTSLCDRLDGCTVRIVTF